MEEEKQRYEKCEENGEKEIEEILEDKEKLPEETAEDEGKRLQKKLEEEEEKQKRKERKILLDKVSIIGGSVGGILACIIGVILIVSWALKWTTANFSYIIIGPALIFGGISGYIRFDLRLGYYECGKCHHRYRPTFIQVMFPFLHFRYIKCPKCLKRSWNKKVFAKNKEDEKRFGKES